MPTFTGRPPGQDARRTFGRGDRRGGARFSAPPPREGGRANAPLAPRTPQTPAAKPPQGIPPELSRDATAGLAKGIPPETPRAPRHRAAAEDTTAPLPEAYSADRLVLIARDPEWAHAYWEADLPRIHRVTAILGEAKAFIRLVDPETNRVFSSAETWAERGRHYLRLPTADRAYRADLVMVTADGKEALIQRSNTIWAPPLFPRRRRPVRLVRLGSHRRILELTLDLLHPHRLVIGETDFVPPGELPEIALEGEPLVPAPRPEDRPIGSSDTAASAATPSMGRT